MHWIERSAYFLFYISTLKSVKNCFYQYFKDFMKKEVFILHIIWAVSSVFFDFTEYEVIVKI